MDAVRRDLYLSLIRRLISRPPGQEVIRNYLFYRWSKFLKRTSVSHFPISIVFYANKVCNFSCSFCYNQEVLNRSDAKDANLTFEQFRRIMESDYGRRALRIAFLGGEPFLNREIFSFIEYCAEKNKISNIVTNASQLRGPLLERVVASPLDVLGISLYDNNREDVLRVVERLNRSRMRYWVQTVCSATALHLIEERVEFLLEAGCRNLILSNYNPNFDGKRENVIYRGNEKYELIEARLKSRVSGRMNVQWINAVFPVRVKKTCPLPISYIHVDNRGDIGACCFRYPKGEVWGNVFGPESWNSKAILELRENLFRSEIPAYPDCENCENLSRDLYSV